MSTALPPLIQQMLKSGFYPHPVSEPIQLIQTHISFLFLTGLYVYKIKKSVNLGFLDYSSLEKRKHFCQQELQRNQRGAPELYLEVIPISKSSNRFELGGSENIIEYALKMRQFSQEELWSHRFERGQLTEDNLEELGRILAKFHAESTTNDYIAGFGRVPRIREAIENNYKVTQKYIGKLQSLKQFEDIKQYTDRFFKQHQDLFDRRIQSGKIRECHGDLHLNNIAQWQGKIILFDCIEFNEPFRFVDVMYDVAFTVMDLEARQRPDLANAFLNTYVEETGDWEGLRLLPLYLTRQAYVRGKVNSFLLDDPAISAQEKRQAAEVAQHYYQLAWDYTQPRQGQLILMSGLSGSGKSTTARQLAHRVGAIQIRSDAVRKHLAGIPLHQRGGDELYTPQMTQKTYEQLLELGVTLATQGWTAILDAKYDRQQWRQGAIACAQANQLPLRILHCTAAMEVMRHRLKHRTGDIADATADLLADQQATAEPFTEFEQNFVKTVDTSKALAPQLADPGRSPGL